MNGTILIVDDDAAVRQVMAAMLIEEGYKVREAANAAALQQKFNAAPPDIILLDLKLPDADGIDLLPIIKRQWPESEVIVLTGFATLDAAVEATKRGAYHFHPKPFDPKSLFLSITRALERKQLAEQTRMLQLALSNMSGCASPVFQSPSMKAMLRTVERIAPSDVSVLIVGESGTGKEVIADLIHTLSSRAKGPFIKINCAALPRELIESELFGSVKGAYTGAQADREGLFHRAEGGTLLLDELTEMPVDTQSKLLRVLEEKQFRPVGGYTNLKVDCRILATTNRVVEEAIRDGKLREDLYFRISAISLYLPPLRERREEIIPLAEAFLKRFAAQAGRIIEGYSPAAIEQLRRFDWPGNVRQLQNEVQRAVLLCHGAMVEPQDFAISAATLANKDEISDLTLIEAMERDAIIEILKETQGNKMEAAKRLGVVRQTLYNKIKIYGIKV
ncbi:MAG: sigma-54 dependent transcriptional regulator [Candidatus Omnitrophica bacterium]|nr:sigma-54 dependent transcriptional regulator [Candidatus Omnitrophota bacterium]